MTWLCENKVKMARRRWIFLKFTTFQNPRDGILIMKIQAPFKKKLVNLQFIHVYCFYINGVSNYNIHLKLSKCPLQAIFFKVKKIIMLKRRKIARRRRKFFKIWYFLTPGDCIFIMKSTPTLKNKYTFNFFIYIFMLYLH